MGRRVACAYPLAFDGPHLRRFEGRVLGDGAEALGEIAVLATQLVDVAFKT